MKRGIKMKRKAVSIILALSMLLPTLNFAVSADEIKTEINSEQTEVLATSSPNEKSTEENIAATNVPLDNSTDTVNINKNDVLVEKRRKNNYQPDKRKVFLNGKRQIQNGRNEQ